MRAFPFADARFAAALALALAAPIGGAPAGAQTYVGTASKDPSDALARSVRILAGSPRDFEALVEAGKASLALGDNQAAAGFFGRAEEAWPQNPQPQIGMAAALAHEGDAASALLYFERAVALGATPSMIGLERGLAHDLLGRHPQAQADYRAALSGADSDEARRRLALSLAISGRKQDALQLLAPLMARGDSAGARTRAFVLALTGDPAGARVAIEAAMPGSSAQMAYFFHRLPSLTGPQKAAAVHLGLFPDAQQVAESGSGAGAADRLESIDKMLAEGLKTAPATAVQSGSPAVAAQGRAARGEAPQARKPTQAPTGRMFAERKVWLQLASSSNADAFADQFRRIRSRDRGLFKGINGHVVEDGDRARLLIGPFRSREDAQIFASDLATLRIDSFTWLNRPGQIVRKLPAE